MIPVEQYLRTSFEYDREYLDGVILERPWPDMLHSRAMAQLAFIFGARRKQLAIHPAISLRLRLAPERIRVADFCAFHPLKPTERVPSTPPFITIEVLSPDDRMADVRAKLEEYRAWGVPHVWLVDPHSRRMYTCETGLIEVPTLRIPELNLEVTPGDIFEE